MICTPACSTIWMSLPHWGRARATISRATPRNQRASRESPHSAAGREAQPLHQGRVSNATNRPSPPRQRPPHEHPEGGERGQKVEKLGRSEGHGCLGQPPEHRLREDQLQQQERQRGSQEPSQNLLIAGEDQDLHLGLLKGVDLGVDVLSVPPCP